MLKIRLKRLGKKHMPYYRVVVMPARTKRSSNTIDELGHYDPIKKDIKIDGDKATQWMKNGAQPTDTVRRLLIKQGVIKADKKEKKEFKKKPGKKALARKPKEEEAPK